MQEEITTLQDGDTKKLDDIFSCTNIENLQICNLTPISFAALCGNFTNVKYLINRMYSLDVNQSNDCNLLTWTMLGLNKQSREVILNYLNKNKIYEQFGDGTDKYLITMLCNQSFENADWDNFQKYNSDGVSSLYFILLYPELSTHYIQELFSFSNIQNIISTNIEIFDDKKNRRLGRYCYIGSYYLCRHQLYELSIACYVQSIKHFELIEKMYTSDYRELSYIYNSLGKMYYKTSQWEKATDCYNKAVLLHNNIHDKILIDHQNLTNYRTNLAGYQQDDIDELYYNRFVDAY